MMPTGAPAKSCSAFWHNSASRDRSIFNPRERKKRQARADLDRGAARQSTANRQRVADQRVIPTSGIPAATNSAATPLL
jgi:hypothetical protein